MCFISNNNTIVQVDWLPDDYNIIIDGESAIVYPTTDTTYTATITFDWVFDDDDPEQITDLSLEPDHRFFTLRDQLDGVEHVIIGPEEFRSNAQPLVNHRGSSQYVALEDIYMNFPEEMLIQRPSVHLLNGHWKIGAILPIVY